MALHDARVFDRDPLTGVTEFFIYDDDTGGFTIQTQQDVEPLVELNKALANSHSDYHRWKGDLHHVASLPVTTLLDLHQKQIVTAGGRVLDQKAFKKYLMDPEHEYLRTKRGRL